MSTEQLVSVVRKTRADAAAAIARACAQLQDSTEYNFASAIARELAKNGSIYPEGWYAPPPGGIAVLFDSSPHDRLLFDTLRKEAYWPSQTSHWGKDSVGIVYVSPVDKTTNVFGDIGFTMYQGDQEDIRKHIQNVYSAVYAVADGIRVGSVFSDVYRDAIASFADRGLTIARMMTMHDPMGMNLGHTAPGAVEGEGPVSGSSFDAVREQIRSRRRYINAQESFQVPATCAFTVEARLTDLNQTMPNTFFHFIVAFEHGEKTIMSNFTDMYEVLGMGYILAA